MTKEITITNLMVSFLIKPIKGFNKILNQPKYNYIYLLIVCYGLFQGINKTLSEYDVSRFDLFLTKSIGAILIAIISIFIICFLYSWIIYFIGFSLKGLANYRMTFTVVCYSLIPLIVGSILIIFSKIVYLNFSGISIETFNSFIYYFHGLFIVWSLYTLVIGYSLINKFSILKSTIGSIGIFFIVGLIYIILQLK